MSLDLYLKRLSDNFKQMVLLVKKGINNTENKSKFVELLNNSRPKTPEEQRITSFMQSVYKLDKYNFISLYRSNHHRFMCQLISGFSIEKTLRIDNILSIEFDKNNEAVLGAPRTYNKKSNKGNRSGKPGRQTKTTNPKAIDNKGIKDLYNMIR
jgi:hypothetical protein